MRRFAWRLQRVLHIKIKQEQAKQTELFRLTQAVAQKRTELLVQQRILQEALAGIAAERSARRLTAQELFLRYATTNDERIRRLTGVIQDLERRRKEKLAELLAVRQFREALERLREEARNRYIQEQERLEQKESDERVVIARNYSQESDDRNQEYGMVVGDSGLDR